MRELSHLDKLEAEAIYILREVAAECEKLVVDFSRADNEPNPAGCRYNDWQMIKLHIWESVLELDASIKRYVVARSYPEDPLVDLIRQNKVGL